MITDPLFAGQQLSSSSEKGRLSLTGLGASGPFAGLAHEPRRHGVQLACVVFPGRSGGPEVQSGATRHNHSDGLVSSHTLRCGGGAQPSRGCTWTRAAAS